MKFRKKPVVVEAMQFTEENIKELLKLNGIAEAIDPEEMESGPVLVMQTINDDFVYAEVGDWIIREFFTTDRFYPCKPDIFETTYERVEE